MNQQKAAHKMINRIYNLVTDLNLPIRLREFGVKEKDISGLAEKALKVTRLLANNPRDIKVEDAEKIYRNAL